MTDLRSVMLAREKALDKATARIVRHAVASLNGAEDELARVLRARLGWIAERGYDSSGRTLKGLEAALLAVGAIVGDAYAAASKEIKVDLAVTARDEAAFQRALLADFGSVKAPDPGAIAAILTAASFLGGRLKDWLAKIAGNGEGRIAGAIRQGLAAHETIDQVVRRVIGSRAKAYADGVTETGRNEMAKVVQLAATHTAGDARAEVWRVNSGLLQAIEWVTIRPCEICEPYSGKLFDPVTHAPLDSDLEWGEGPGKKHINCRCVGVPVISEGRLAA